MKKAVAFFRPISYIKLMLDLPLHPVVVHFPITLGLLLPIFSIILLVGIKKGMLNPQAWGLASFLAGLYFLTALVAVNLGEDEEETVKPYVIHEVLEEHEEAGDLIPWIAGGIFLLTLTPLALKYRTHLQILTILVSALGVAPLIDAGHSGGKLVYIYGAAAAYPSDIEEDPVEEVYDDSGEGLTPEGDEDADTVPETMNQNETND